MLIEEVQYLNMSPNHEHPYSYDAIAILILLYLDCPLFCIFITLATRYIFVDFLDLTMMYPRANIIEKTGNHIIIFVVDVVDGLLLAFQPLNISNLLPIY